MKITNKYNLPEQLMTATKKSQRTPDKKIISCTQLISPAWQRHLQIKHWDEIEEDVSDRLWSILGSSVHSILSTDHSNTITEERLEFAIDGVTITGQSDSYTEGGIISDWKVTSVYSFLLGDKFEWEQQLNIYAWLWEKNGFPVTQLKINAILRDHQHSKTMSDDGYPKIPFVSKTIPLHSFEEREEFVKKRIKVHAMDCPPMCSPEERWERPTKYAVMKKGRKSAVRVFDTEEEAKKLLPEVPSGYIDIRPGTNARCGQYCNVARFCMIGN
jgi:hypothetical protein